MFKWLFRLVILIAVSLMAFAVFYFYQDNSGGVDIIIKLPDKIMVGQAFDVSVGIVNASDKILSSAKLNLNLPDGLAFVGNDENANLKIKSLGDIGVGGLTSYDFSLIALSDSNSVKALEVNLNYGTPSSATRFEKKKTGSFLVGESAIDLKMEIAEKTASNDELEIKIFYKNNSGADLQDVKLKIDYPPVFKFVKSSLKPDEDNNVWDLGGLHAGSEDAISVFGSLVAPADTVLDFKAYLQLGLDGKIYNINEQVSPVTIDKSSFGTQIKINDENNYIAHPGDVLNYSINFSERLDNLKIQVSGEMIDYFAPLNLFSPQSPVQFQVRVRDNYPSGRLGDKNFLIKTIVEGRVGKDVNVAKLETKVGGRIVVMARGYFRDAASGVLNKGSLPPKVGETTQFTIHWLLNNFGTDKRNISVKAGLPAGIRFVNDSTKSSLATAPLLNADRREVVWSIDRILAIQGSTNNSIEAIFQVEAVPTDMMAGQYMPLLGETIVEALDEFTGQTLTAASAAITTALPDDATVGSQGIVTKN